MTKRLKALCKSLTKLIDLSSLFNLEQHLGERNKYVESEIALWIEAVLNDPIPPKDFDDLLRDGVLLCRVMNTLKPGLIGKIQKPWTKDNQRANIQAFIDAARAYGVPDEHLFSVEDLHEKKGIPNVTKCMVYLGKSVSISDEELGLIDVESFSVDFVLTRVFPTFRTISNIAQIYDHPEWQGPYLGPRPTGHIIDWPEDKLRAAEGIVRLQAGTNKFASQRGLRIGTARDIMFANTCVEDKEGLAEWHEPENKENGEEQEAQE